MWQIIIERERKMSIEYDLYLEKHKENVRNAFQWLSTNLPELFIGRPSSEWQIDFNHDCSKYNALNNWIIK